MENKELICRYLLWALQKTRNLGGLRDLVYSEEKGIVYAISEGCTIKEINVEADSGIAMIKDIVRALEQ